MKEVSLNFKFFRKNSELDFDLLIEILYNHEIGFNLILQKIKKEIYNDYYSNNKKRIDCFLDINAFFMQHELEILFFGDKFYLITNRNFEFTYFISYNDQKEYIKKIINNFDIHNVYKCYFEIKSEIEKNYLKSKLISMDGLNKRISSSFLSSKELDQRLGENKNADIRKFYFNFIDVSKVNIIGTSYDYDNNTIQFFDTNILLNYSVLKIGKSLNDLSPNLVFKIFSEINFCFLYVLLEIIKKFYSKDKEIYKDINMLNRFFYNLENMKKIIEKDSNKYREELIYNALSKYQK